GEGVHESAREGEIVLYRVTTGAGIEAAIRDAADRGAAVILVALGEIRTLGDADPATNRYLDDVAYAKAKGAAVVFAAGDEAQRQYAATFAACGQACADAAGGGSCSIDASDYHDFGSAQPLDPPIFPSPR